MSSIPALTVAERLKNRFGHEKTVSPPKLPTAGPSRSTSLQSIASQSISRDGQDKSTTSPIARRSSQTRLLELRGRISGFEQQLEDEARTRKENEENRVSAIRDSIINLDKTLNAEVKRRVEANKALQSMFEAQIATVHEKMDATFAEKLDQLQTAVEKLCDRLTLVEEDLRETGLLTTVEQKCSAVSKEVSALQGQLEAESNARQSREGATMKQLGTIEQFAESKFDEERAQRERSFATIREEIEEARETRIDDEEKFQNFSLEEISTLKNNLDEEGKIREQADDDIVQALNCYTEVLQHALRIANTE